MKWMKTSLVHMCVEDIAVHLEPHSSEGIFLVAGDHSHVPPLVYLKGRSELGILSSSDHC